MIGDPTLGERSYDMKNRCLRRWSGILASVLLIFSMPEITSAGDSGVEGVITVSPARPGPIRKGESNQAPVADTAFVVKKGDEKVAAFTTDATGHFRVMLPAGHYIVYREDTGVSIGHWQFEVDVSADKMASVQWTGDSGMR